ncbi:MAG: serine hydrolase [Legionellaceae bacterium]|nr:serine hydrolase [Legionellaceae bacterium]
MSKVDDLVEGLQRATGKAALPEKFWVDYSKDDTHTFQDVLDKYTAYYCARLNAAQKKAMSQVFWAQIENIGSPIIEDIPGRPDKCAVYFLFPKNKVHEGNDLYLQGDFHGYGATPARARLATLESTDIMFRHDVMDKDATVVYEFVQLPPSIQDKTPTELAGSRLVEPPQDDYFPKNSPSTLVDEVPPNLESPANWSGNPETILKAEHSKHRPAFFIYGEDKIFRVNADEKLACLPGAPLDWNILLSKTPVADKHFVLHDVFYSNREGNIKAQEHTPPEVFIQHGHESPYNEFTRVMYVLKPKAGTIENLVLVNDGLGYLHSGALQQFEHMVKEGQLSPQTGLVFVHTLPALAKTIEVPEGNEKAALEGMGERTIEYEYGREAYAHFIRNQLFQQLTETGFIVPADKHHRVMIGSSLSGTFSVWLASAHPELFGAVIAQSPSPSNRSILNDIVANYDGSNPRAQILLSCGQFEAPGFAANDNLGYTKQLSSRLNIPIQEVGAHGHQFLPWTIALKRDLPEAVAQNQQQAQLQALVTAHNVAGASVAVLDNKGISTFSAGKLVEGEEQSVTPSAVFEAASLSKPVFAYIVLKMVERGDIDLDTPLCQLSRHGFGPPELRATPEYQQLTTRQVLSHQSGLPNWAVKLTYEAQPGRQFNYSGLAFQCLGEVAEEVSGLSLEALAKRELEPLGIIQSSYFYQPEDTAPEKKRFAVGHNAAGVPDEKSHYVRKSEENSHMLFEKPIPAASLFITAAYYATFLTACLQDDFVRPLMFSEANDLAGRDLKAIEKEVTPDVLERLHWGLGIGIQTNADGSKAVFHWGDAETFRHLAVVRVSEDNSYEGVVCLSNSANGPAIFRQIAEPVVGSIKPITDWLIKRENLPLSHHAPAESAGISRTQSMKGAIDKLKENDSDTSVSNQYKHH